MLHDNLESFLKIGIIFAIFRLSGKVPVRKDKLIISVSGKHIMSFVSWSIEVGILKGPTLLAILRFDMRSIHFRWRIKFNK